MGCLEDKNDSIASASWRSSWRSCFHSPPATRADGSRVPEPYYNEIEEEHYPDPPQDFCGGILADNRGAGKTLAMIALIAHDQSTLAEVDTPGASPGVSPRATLVVIPAPGKSHPSRAAEILLTDSPVKRIWAEQLFKYLNFVSPSTAGITVR